LDHLIRVKHTEAERPMALWMIFMILMMLNFWSLQLKLLVKIQIHL
jgi:hypothetical protein